MDYSSEQIIELLNLKPLAAEGGYFRRNYLSLFKVSGRGPGGEREYSTGSAIYYLVTDGPQGFSRLHTLKKDEIYHFYMGDPAELVLIDRDYRFSRIVLGRDLAGGQVFQYPVPAGFVQAVRPVPGGKWTLLGTTMAPAYDEDDFSLPDIDALIERIPERRDMIMELKGED